MKKILIVEDNELNRKLFKDILEAHGYETLEASTGTDAITLAAETHPDMVILDMQLPEINGEFIVRWMKNDAQLQHVPIVAVTAFAMKADERRFLDTGVDAYLPKPISIDKFMRTIEQTMILSQQLKRQAC